MYYFKLAWNCALAKLCLQPNMQDKQAFIYLTRFFYQTISGDWGEAAGAEGFIERDMILKPDLSTATAAPWTGDWTIQVIHDAFDRKGNRCLMHLGTC